MNPLRRWVSGLRRPPAESPRRLRLADELEQPWQLNEAVSFELECIFIAVPKTGTTSVRTQISPPGPYLIPQPHLNIVEIRDSLFSILLRRALTRNQGFPTANVPTTAEVQAEAQALFKRFFKFSAVRNPWARAVSLYARKEGNIQLRETMTFEAFCEAHLYASDTCRHPTLHRNQLDWVTDESGQVLADYLYRIEDFAEAIDEIRERTDGRISIEPIERNRNQNSNSRNYCDMYNDRARQAIARAFEKDIDTFKYTF